MIVNEQIYSLTVLDPSGTRYNPYCIQKQLEKILEDSQQCQHQAKASPILPVGAITALDRDRSASLRLRLGQHNQSSLNRIDSALFAVTLDQDCPRSVDQAGEWINGGKDETPGNRWFEKAVNFVIFRNGYVGLTGEHCPLDAPMVGTLADFILGECVSCQGPRSEERRVGKEC